MARGPMDRAAKDGWRHRVIPLRAFAGEPQPRLGEPERPVDGHGRPQPFEQRPVRVDDREVLEFLRVGFEVVLLLLARHERADVFVSSVWQHHPPRHTRLLEYRVADGNRVGFGAVSAARVREEHRPCRQAGRRSRGHGVAKGFRHPRCRRASRRRRPSSRAGGRRGCSYGPDRCRYRWNSPPPIALRRRTRGSGPCRRRRRSPDASGDSRQPGGPSRVRSRHRFRCATCRHGRCGSRACGTVPE